jgi:uncharacterized membrane protein YeaQ/YmgE (transglycosylase-associated protein family)
MKVIAQSQPSAGAGYIHLAYISAQLDYRISKGELLPVQAMLGVALATAVACGMIASKLAQPGRRQRAIKMGVVLGFFGTIAALWFFQMVWSESQSNEAAVRHVIKTRQFWALREPALAAGIEASAATNATAASMAADYYGMKYNGKDGAPEQAVKSYRYCELAAAQGQGSRWAGLFHLTNDWYVQDLEKAFEAALKNGKLSPEEESWTKRQLTRIAEQLHTQDSDNAKH